MTRLIDARTSMGINATDFNPDPFPSDTPVLVGQVGLNVPSTTPGIIRAQFDGIVGIQLPETPTGGIFVTLTLVRGFLPTDDIVYESFSSFDTVNNNQLIPFSASDYNVPAPAGGELVYTLFLETPNAGPFVLRSGPENFNASVYTD
ncbi:hypothetical protein [Paenibacillus glycinis]|uniref:Exosporium leader peptide n=1 Tax=Paenibacillus glycinis TaxID=2697035 RepID=A0ABW9XQN7_9BACL|nr:hypothetical protein [Paenibacillus glycinis]NBD24940.1 hypothetical protein [Paenibacillus glycinis]